MTKHHKLSQTQTIESNQSIESDRRSRDHRQQRDQRSWLASGSNVVTDRLFLFHGCYFKHAAILRRTHFAIQRDPLIGRTTTTNGQQVPPTNGSQSG